MLWVGPLASASAATPKSVSAPSSPSPSPAPSRLPQPGPRFYAASWAVVVGIDRYASAEIPRRPGAESDAAQVARALTRLGFPRRNIRLLTGPRATRAAILRTLKRDLKPRMGERDRLLIYFSGRAATMKMRGEDAGYLLAYDAEVERWPGDASPYLRESPGRALGMRALLSTLKSLSPRHKLVAVDASFSGYGLPVKDLHAVVAAPTIPDIERWLRRSVTHVFAAERGGRPAVGEETGRRGAFTKHLLDGLAGMADTAGGRADGVLNFDELAAYVRNRMVHAPDSPPPPQAAQTGDGRFLFLVPSNGSSRPGPALAGQQSGARLGFNKLGVAYVEEHLRLMKRDLGIRPVKLHLGLHARESGPNFGNYDKVVNAAVSLGLPFVLTMAYVPDTWIETYGPAGWQSVWIERYLLPSVRRYAGKPGFIGMEIWNEPFYLNWSSRHAPREVFPDAESYVAFLRRCRRAIAAAGLEARLISAATLNILQGGDKFFRKAIRLAELLPPGVAYNLHLYGTDVLRFIAYAREIKSVLKEGTDIFITEFGDGRRENHFFVYNWMRPIVDFMLKPKFVFWYRLIANAKEKDSRSHALLRYSEDPRNPVEAPLYQLLKREHGERTIRSGRPLPGRKAR